MTIVSEKNTVAPFLSMVWHRLPFRRKVPSFLVSMSTIQTRCPRRSSQWCSLWLSAAWSACWIQIVRCKTCARKFCRFCRRNADYEIYRCPMYIDWPKSSSREFDAKISAYHENIERAKYTATIWDIPSSSIVGISICSPRAAINQRPRLVADSKFAFIMILTLREMRDEILSIQIGHKLKISNTKSLCPSQRWKHLFQSS